MYRDKEKARRMTHPLSGEIIAPTCLLRKYLLAKTPRPFSTQPVHFHYHTHTKHKTVCNRHMEGALPLL